MRVLRMLGVGEPEAFRGRVYGVDEQAETRRLAFVRELGRDGVIDAPVYDGWIAALIDRGWLADPTFEAATARQLDGRPVGKVKRWRLNDAGRAALAAIEKLESER